MTKERVYLSIRLEKEIVELIRSHAHEHNITLGEAVVSLIKSNETGPQ